MPIALIIAALIVAGGGVSAAAQNAQPGTPLYPVKVGLDDKVHSYFDGGASADTYGNGDVDANTSVGANSNATSGGISTNSSTDPREVLQADGAY